MLKEAICYREEIVAYLDGELDETAQAVFEEHVEECDCCRSELNAHRVLLCELDSVMTEETNNSTPKDFARIVAAHAESDMRGVRTRAEHKRALKFVVVLTLFAFSLLGTSFREVIIDGGKAIATNVFGLVNFVWKAIYDTAASGAVISKVLSRKFVIESGSSGLLVVFLCLAVLLLSYLIASYHRSRAIE